MPIAAMTRTNATSILIVLPRMVDCAVMPISFSFGLHLVHVRIAGASRGARPGPVGVAVDGRSWRGRHLVSQVLRRVSGNWSRWCHPRDRDQVDRGGVSVDSERSAWPIGCLRLLADCPICEFEIDEYVGQDRSSFVQGETSWRT